MDGWWLTLGVLAIAVAVLIAIARSSRNARAGKPDRRRDEHRASPQERQEALFKATFPELQPLFHPAKVLEFVEGWRAREPGRSSAEWHRPPGLNAARARLSPGEKGEAVELFDSAGAVVSRFRLQQHPDGGVLRLDPGKFTVNVAGAAVRYWHPEREFKWSRAKGWRLITRLSDEAIESSDSGITTRDTSSSPSSAAATAAAVIAGAGGAFAGAGASAKWDDAAESPAGSESGSGAALVGDAPLAAAADAGPDTGSDTGSDAGSDAPSSGTAY